MSFTHGPNRVLIANRGEIAVRIVRACRDLGIETVLAHSTADAGSLGCRLADRTVCIGGAAPAESYLNGDAIVVAAVGTGCDAVHPGYGFLAENAAFAEACEEHGLTFIGPRPETIRELGDKVNARTAAVDAGIPVVPGIELDPREPDDAELARVGLPVLIKAAAGGGGRGLRRVDDRAALEPALRLAASEAAQSFGDPRLYVERYVVNARHIEVQVLGDGAGEVVHLYERDCTVQRRFQKLIEEAPSPALDSAARTRIVRDARRLASAVGYRGAGTVEFLFDPASGEHFFIEMNTRLQVEHPVTEILTGLDLVALQLRAAGGHGLGLEQDAVRPRGNVLEFRVNAEDPDRAFRPAAGDVTAWRPPQGPWVRVDTHVSRGDRVSPYYDSMLAKLLVQGRTREEAIRRAERALREFEVGGIPTTVGFHRWVAGHDDFRASRHHTTWVDETWLHAIPDGPGARALALT